jgi:hypothetical protein
MKKVERWKMEMPTEEEMLPKDKYTVFDRKVKRYRKGIHSKRYSPPGRLSGCMLTVRRGAKVDEGQPAPQSPWFLDGRGTGCAGFIVSNGLSVLLNSFSKVDRDAAL